MAAIGGNSSYVPSGDLRSAEYQRREDFQPKGMRPWEAILGLLAGVAPAIAERSKPRFRQDMSGAVQTGLQNIGSVLGGMEARKAREVAAKESASARDVAAWEAGESTRRWEQEQREGRWQAEQEHLLSEDANRIERERLAKPESELDYMDPESRARYLGLKSQDLQSKIALQNARAELQKSRAQTATMANEAMGSKDAHKIWDAYFAVQAEMAKASHVASSMGIEDAFAKQMFMEYTLPGLKTYADELNLKYFELEGRTIGGGYFPEAGGGGTAPLDEELKGIRELIERDRGETKGAAGAPGTR